MTTEMETEEVDLNELITSYSDQIIHLYAITETLTAVIASMAPEGEREDALKRIHNLVQKRHTALLQEIQSDMVDDSRDSEVSELLKSIEE